MEAERCNVREGGWGGGGVGGWEGGRVSCKASLEQEEEDGRRDTERSQKKAPPEWSVVLKCKKLIKGGAWRYLGWSSSQALGP